VVANEDGFRPEGEFDSVDHPADLGDMLQELRILLNGVQVLTAFLVVLPFSEGFSKLNEVERYVYLMTFVCSVIALVLFAAPAAQHRLMRPLPDRVAFKHFSTNMAIIGLVPFSLCLILSAYLVATTILGTPYSLVVPLVVAIVIGIIWWAIPLSHRRR
jgi:hypothetical protein